jgi:hypothetical protein
VLERTPFETLDNGFQSCGDPEKLQQICNELGPNQIDRMFRKWLDRLPLPLSTKDRQAGYDYKLSIWQMEVSLTQIFDRRIIKTTPGRFRTRVIQDGVNPSLHIEYKQFDLKQYFKEGRGLRTEGTFRNLKDFNINLGLSNLPYAQQVGRNINRRLLEVERVSHNCGLSADSIQRVVQPTVTEDGQKAPGLKFGHPRVMALFLALTMFQSIWLHTPPVR